MADFTLAEIKNVLKGFKKDKIPGHDGWPVEFFLHFFELVGVDILGMWINLGWRAGS